MTTTAGSAPTSQEVSDLRRRVDELESDVARLKGHLREDNDRPAAPPARSEAPDGAFADDPGFDEMVRLGREWREQQRAQAQANGEVEDAGEGAADGRT